MYKLLVDYYGGEHKETTIYESKNEARITAYSLIVSNGRISNIDIMDNRTGELITTYTATRKISISYDNGEY